MIRMIATDLDGTLLAGKSNLPQENIAALRRAMDAGVMVVLSSGRMIEATLSIARQIGVNAPMVLANGAMVYDMAQDRVLYSRTIPRDTAVKVLRCLEERGQYVQAFPERNYYFEKRCHWTDYYAAKIEFDGIEVGKPLSQWLDTDVFKLLVLAHPDEAQQLIEELSPKFPEVCFVKSGETHLEIIAKGVDKATGMAALSEITGVSPDEMLAFGDEMNDLPMLLYAGTGYAMANAVEPVRMAIPRTAPHNTNCGVAKIVNQYLNEGKMGRGEIHGS